jgi:hypothetical protein
MLRIDVDALVGGTAPRTHGIGKPNELGHQTSCFALSIPRKWGPKASRQPALFSNWDTTRSFRIGVGAGVDVLHDLGPMLHDLAWSVVRSPVSFST